MKAAELAATFGLSVQTVMYYETIGLIKPLSDGSYGDAAKVRLAVIRKGKRLGFSLSEIKLLMDMRMAVEPGSVLSGSGAAQNDDEQDGSLKVVLSKRPT